MVLSHMAATLLNTIYVLCVQDKLHSESMSGEALQMWVAQKYIEHPLIIRGR